MKGGVLLRLLQFFSFVISDIFFSIFVWLANHDLMTQEKQNIDWFKTVFNDYFEYIRNYIYYLSGDIALAEDLTQDVFLAFWEEQGRIKKETVRAYLFTIAKNLFFKYHRRKKINLTFISSLIPEQDHQSPEFVLELKEFDQALQKLIGRIPEKTRVIFLMNRIDRLTYTEIAETMKISIKAVEKHMTKALKFLRENMDQKF
ncbi:MAG: RNA polymerase sigma factor [Mangrovibacterium sp.]